MLAITGATGFIGQHLLRHAQAHGYAVRALTRRAQHPRQGITWIEGSLEDRESLVRLVSRADAVIHVAGLISAPDRATFEAGNVGGTLALVEAARLEGARRFVHVSSLAAREPQLSGYGWSKAKSEAVVASAPLDWTIVRPPAVYGSGDREMLELFRMAKRGLVALPPGGRLSLIAVDDLVALLLALALVRDEEPAIYEPDDGHPGGISHAELARALGEAIGRRRVRTLAMPRSFLHLIGRIEGAARGAQAKLTADRIGYFCHPDWVSRADAQPPRDLWRPEIPLAEGLKATADWYRAAKWL